MLSLIASSYRLSSSNEIRNDNEIHNVTKDGTRPVLRLLLVSLSFSELVCTNFHTRVHSCERTLSTTSHGREVKLSIGGSVHDPTDPVGRLFIVQRSTEKPVFTLGCTTPKTQGLWCRRLRKMTPGYEHGQTNIERRHQWASGTPSPAESPVPLGTGLLICTS
jgi:hypothetical protein